MSNASGLSAGRPSTRSTTPGVTVRDLMAEDTVPARINFQVPRELRDKFKVWAVQNNTTIKDELTRHILSLIK
ncbi:hypothetical protein SAMN06295924_12316 [Rathayibacter rathayi NCPPB 2980 = VKM Ac-1601]|uniref:Uncharacterized protein n=1 Tax=Rathayibacter rathayi TaxID=33887 RepID=A0ABX5A7P3_RATRA|nr:hypothetical protein [Rathayibacter rathayi]MWV76098.1 hypothetical protein [Rathayibacter rathayi NCPPB 2980 = VKM Ac-1601]PPG65154.1 hypothetical protein C5C16_13635 [Rathayibacter rathayi]PPG74205.1 hypothetical protein C5C15_15240 [Rathayibacter rathayi]PPG87532.1 hypothetical protein C5C47_10150 [Rathayibacter rathayi]PPG95104.1 hypothetical protein C5C00_10820 [Rathayibacter rathayi]